MRRYLGYVCLSLVLAACGVAKAVDYGELDVGRMKASTLVQYNASAAATFAGGVTIATGKTLTLTGVTVTGGTFGTMTLTSPSISSPTISGTVTGGSSTLNNGTIATTNLTVYGLSRTTGVATNTATVTFNGGTLTASGQTETKTGVTVTGGNYAAQSLSVSGAAIHSGVSTNTGAVQFNGGLTVLSGQTATFTGVTMTGGTYGSVTLTAPTVTGTIAGGSGELDNATIVTTNLTAYGASTLSGGGTLTGTFVGGSFTNTTILGAPSVSIVAGAGVDSLSAGALKVGVTTATSVDVGVSACPTTVKGTLNVDEAVTLDSTLGVTGNTTLTRILALTPTSLAVTNLQVVTPQSSVYTVEGIGQAINSENTITLANPTITGQLLFINCTATTTNYVKIADTGNALLSGDITMTTNGTLTLVGVGTEWKEFGRCVGN